MTFNAGRHKYPQFLVELMNEIVGISYYPIPLVILMTEIVGETIKTMISLQKEEILNFSSSSSKALSMTRQKE